MDKSFVDPINQNATRITEDLDYVLCASVDFPKSGIDCSTRNISVCFRCMMQQSYFTAEESINDFHSTGHLTCRIIGIMTVLVSVVGVITNSLIVKIIKRRNHKRSFDFLLKALSYIDSLCCLACIVYSPSHISYYDNLFGRGKLLLYWVNVSSTTVLMCRVLSMYITLVIAMERYVAIACPIRSRAWYSLGKTKLQTGLVTGLVLLVTIPGYFRLYVTPNIYGSQEGGLDVPSLREFEYIFMQPRLYSVIMGNKTLVLCNYLFQYWIPIPVLLYFNIITYRKVKLLKENRQHLTSSHQKELQPALMFLPVVVVFLVTNIWPMIMLFTLQVWGLNYREIWMSFFLATAVNSSVNFWIYYFWGTSFRADTKSLVSGRSFNRSTVSKYSVQSERRYSRMSTR